MFVVLIDIMLCAALIFLIYKRTQKGEHNILKRVWGSAFVSTLITIVVDTIYNEGFGGSAGPLSMDIENFIFLIVIVLGLCVFAICSIIAGFVYFEKMKQTYVKMLCALVLAIIHNIVYSKIYVSRELTEANDHLWLGATFGVTVILYIIIMATGALNSDKKQPNLIKLLYWLLPTLVLLIPIISMADSTMIRWE